MQVQAYVIFSLSNGADREAVKAELRMSLHMCKQLFIGAHGQDLFYFIDCTEDREKNNLNAAVAKLAAADGIERATLVSVKR